MSSSDVFHKENSSSSDGAEENPPPPKKKGRGSRTSKKNIPTNAEDSCIASRLRSSTPLPQSEHRSIEKRQSSTATKAAAKFEFEIAHMQRSLNSSPLRDKNSRTVDDQDRLRQHSPMSIGKRTDRNQKQKLLPCVTAPELPTNEDDDDFILPEFGLLDSSPSTSSAALAAPRCLLDAAEILREREMYEKLQGNMEETDSDDDNNEFLSPANTSAISFDAPPLLIEGDGEQIEMKFAQLTITHLNPLQIFTAPVRKMAQPGDMASIPENLLEYAFNQLALGNLRLPQDLTTIFIGYSPNFSQLLAMFYIFGADFTSSLGCLSEEEKSEAIEYADRYLRFSSENCAQEAPLRDNLGRFFELQCVVGLPSLEKIPLYARLLMDIALDARVISVDPLRIYIGVLLERCAQAVPVPPKTFTDWLPMHFIAHLASTSMKFPAVWRPEFSAHALYLLLPGEDFANFDEFLPIFVRRAKLELAVCPEKLYTCLHLIRLGLNEEILGNRIAELRQLRAVLTDLQKSIREDKQYQLARLKMLIKRILVLIADDQQQGQDFFGGTSLLARDDDGLKSIPEFTNSPLEPAEIVVKAEQWEGD